MSDSSEDVMAWLEDQRAAALDEKWDRSVPKRFRAARVVQLAAALRDPLLTWSLEGQLPNVVLFGPVGTGKTHAALAAARVAMDLQGLSPAFWPVSDLLEGLRPGAGDDHPARAAHRAGILILDDLGAEKPSDWTGERLYSIVNHRWLMELPTVVTCNATKLEELPELCGPRVWSRLAQGALLLRVGGPDRRLANG